MIKTFKEAADGVRMLSRPLTVSVLTTCTNQKYRETRRAEELYLGQHHLRLMRGVTRYRERGGDCAVSIVSAGHGVVSGEHHLSPYDVTFNAMGHRYRTEVARRLGIPEAAEAFLMERRDLKIIALSSVYLEACAFDFSVARGAVVVFCSAAWSLRIPERPALTVVPLENKDAIEHRVGQIALKGELAAKLLEIVAELRFCDDQQWMAHGCP